jgi:hypothetical protein
MSALPPKADIHPRQLDVRFVPKADLAAPQANGGVNVRGVCEKLKSLTFGARIPLRQCH